MSEALQESPDINRGRSVAYELWGEQKAEQLKDKVKKAKGRMFVLVHPTMARESMPTLSHKIDAALLRGIDSHWPVVFFEEDDFDDVTPSLGASKKLLQHLKTNVPTLEPYIVPTEWDDPTPPDMSPFKGSRNDRWDTVRSLFDYLGASSVRVGGVYLTIAPDTQDISDPREDMGCVNLIWKELAKSSHLNVFPALSDGIVRGAPTTSRVAGDQLREFLEQETRNATHSQSPE